MKNKLLAEIAYSALTDDLCEGCDKYDSPFSYENGGSSAVQKDGGERN